MKTARPLCLLLLAALPTLACRPAAAPQGPRAATPEARPLPTGLRLDPAGRSFDVGNMPLAIATPPGDAARAVVLLSGWRQQGLQVIDLAAGRVLQTVEQPAAFLGLAFSPDGHTLYASGGNEDAIFRYRWEDGTVTLIGRIALAPKESPQAKKEAGTRFPAGLALSPDGRTLYVAENLGDSLAVVDLASGRVIERHPTERFPYGVVTAADGTVYVSAWGGTTVAVFTPASGAGGHLTEAGRIAVGRHPSALLLNAAGTRLFVASASTDRVAVVDTAARKVMKELLDPPPAGPAEGSTPNALALSPDGARLYVAEADANAVAVFDLSAATAGTGVGGAAHGDDRLAGRIPAGWYPTALLVRGNTLAIVNGKGKGTGPNPDGAVPGVHKAPPHAYTLGQLDGTVTVLSEVPAGTDLAALTRRVIQADRWDRPRQPRKYPPFEHVVYVIKENRTYDQVLGDLPGADGDPGLTLFPRPVSPNHHALAERFGLFDRFFVNAEVSTQGHSWSTASYVTDYGEKTTPSGYSDRRPELEEGETDEAAGGYLWNLALAKGLSVRDYGEATSPVKKGGQTTWVANRPGLGPFVHPDYPGWDLDVPDQRRADLWLADLDGFAKSGKMPALEVVWLPSDHTSGATPGKFTPRGSMADNDLALGRMIEGLSRSPFFKSTLVLVLEDDAQNGPDHVDSHRSVLLVISPYNRPGAVHRFVNTTDVMETIEEVLGLPALSHYDHFGRPLSDVFTAQPDLRPYVALKPDVPIGERNPPKAPGAAASARLDLSAPDRADEAAFNRILWTALRGPGVPYPKPGRVSVLELQRGR
jgi:sugar lactone lactonase YvrE